MITPATALRQTPRPTAPNVAPECARRYPASWTRAMLRAQAADHDASRERSLPASGDRRGPQRRGAVETSVHPLTLRIPPLVLTVLAGLGAWGVARTFPSLSFDSLYLRAMAVTLVVVGVVCSLLGVVAFRQARTTVNPLKPSAATALLESGIFRVTRNPMYLGFLCWVLGVIGWLGNPIALVAAAAFVVYLNRFQIGPEERALHEQFGARFTAYLALVPRWL